MDPVRRNVFTRWLVVLLASCGVCFAHIARADQPNVIVIFTDDQGWADLSCQQSVPDIRTPHIDRMAAEGVRLTSGYVTAPQCVPSRAGLISGTYQQRFGVGHNGEGPLPLTLKTLPQRLSDIGYVTGIVGKWHLEPNHTCREWVDQRFPDIKGPARRNLRIPPRLQAPYLPEKRGFSDFFHGHFASYSANFDLQGQSLDPAGERVDTGLYRLEAQSRAALAFIRRNKAQPFFLYLAYFAPHVPLEATEKYLNRFPGEMPERRRYALAMISAIDDGVGSILDELKKQGIDGNTLLFFISDNGAPTKIEKEDRPISFRGGAWDGSLNDPWVGEKGMLTEGGIRVPFVMRWKGMLPAATVYDEPVISLDVAATSLALAGSEDLGDLDGVNLVPYLTGKQAGPPHEELYWRFWGQAAVRSGKWKLLYLANGNKYLFDLSTPDHEHRNLLTEHPQVADRLEKKLAAWAQQLKRPGLPAGELNPQELRWYEHYLGR
jgi:arylsulfatase A-like enzyme